MTDQPLQDREDAQADEHADPEIDDTDQGEETEDEPGD